MTRRIHQAKDMVGCQLNFSMPARLAQVDLVEPLQNLRHMAWLRPDVENRCAYGQYIINFAGVNQPNERTAHDDDMSVRRR